MISIIIVNYHVDKELFLCLQSIYNSKPKVPVEIIVVDNNETKTIYSELKKKFPKVIYVKNDNKGFGQGNNVGAQHAKGEYLFFLNPDTKIEEGSVDILSNYLNTHKKVGIVAPILKNISGKLVDLQGARELTPIHAIFGFSFISKLFPKNFIANKYWYKDEWNKKIIKEVESIPGTAFVIRKNIYEKIGGFDEKFFLYFEEHDICKRVIKLGWKVVMHPEATVKHVLGASTRKSNKDIKKIFNQSRFYYFKKHFGILPALFTELILRLNKYIILLITALLTGVFLRVYNIQALMPFIGDQGWFYLSARDLVLNGQIPLVGIASSHPWLHQGAFWTYLLAFCFKVFGFNPLNGAYLSTLIDTLTVFFVYIFGSKMFSKRIAIIAAFFYATSPLIIFNAQMPYHTSPIPLVTTFFLFFLYKWINGNVKFFPLVILTLAILYNFELATLLLTIIVLIILAAGLIRKSDWARKIFNKKILIYSLLGFAVPMSPMIIYDFSHNFAQTIKIVIWIFYRVLLVFNYPPVNPIPAVSLNEMIYFFVESFRKFLFPSNGLIAVLLFILGFLNLLFYGYKDKKIMPLAFINVFLLLGLFITKTPSGAYLPMIFPFIIFVISLFFDKFLRNKKILIKVLVLLIFTYLLISNSYYVLQINAKDNHFTNRFIAADNIVKMAGEKEYNLKGEGPGSKYESFTMNYEYLTWWLGHGPSNKKQKLTFIISESSEGITVQKEVLSIKY